jgi:hypothetical protein
MKTMIFAAALASVTLLAAPAQAHHAFAAEFDAAKPVALQGSITKVRFVNPHSWIYVDVKAKDGTVSTWGFEFGTPSSLRNNGLTREDVEAGSAITIQGFKAKNGGNFGYAVQVTLANGRKVSTGSAPDAPPAKS